MKYSIIVPTYNSERWIQSSVKSILAQTFTGFDVIILDSGSTDGTLAWIRSLYDPRIKIFTTDKRLSITENWQRIVMVPRNEFMTIMGHDDVLYPDYLSAIDNLIKQFPDAGLYQTHFNFIDGNGQLIRACTSMEKVIKPEQLIESVLQNKIEIVATGFIMRSRDYDAIGGIPSYPNLLYADTELWIRLIRQNYLAVAPEACFDFRFHIDNTSKSPGKIRLIAFEKMIDFFCRLTKESQQYKLIIDRNAKVFLESYVIGACHKLIYVPKSNRDNVTMEMIIESAKKCAQKLLPGIQFLPEKFSAIRLAKLIDSNTFLRRLFLFYKSFQKRTF